jgi:hypothetical protein
VVLRKQRTADSIRAIIIPTVSNPLRLVQVGKTRATPRRLACLAPGRRLRCRTPPFALTLVVTLPERDTGLAQRGQVMSRMVGRSLL